MDKLKEKLMVILKRIPANKDAYLVIRNIYPRENGLYVIYNINGSLQRNGKLIDYSIINK